jgi:hypothetical protein
MFRRPEGDPAALTRRGGMPRMPRRDHKELLRDARHEEEVRQARQVPGYKGRWRIAWSQVVGLLLVAAIFVGLVLLVLHAHPLFSYR